ncbi:HAD-IIIC family phosphatase [Paenibacillus tundrae]|uniref:HAD-IIIC family phosphatase n=1 Tax=Paenibacillus tundrae TaxID=528187 RepID=UPI0022A8E486|nr:HAD-IIIC family phosphatase [Paenibacillus tundrae]MCZ1264754.1 HAD-IIIC family phosphatase [Paenibacillus tundrae]
MIKCVVWDLDNTLWQGIISEELSVELRPGIKDFLQLINDKGIIQSIASRNDREPVMEKLKQFSVDDYFILPQISWDNKAVSIKKIMNRFKIKSNNVLFIDDNQFERDQIKAHFPEIMIEDGSDLSKLLILIEQNDNYGSEEASERIQYYKTEELRLSDKEHFHGTELDFMISCRIKVEILHATIEDLDRVKELIDRTNQMNATGIRFTREEIVEMINSTDNEVYISIVNDKYGSYGRSGLLIIDKSSQRREYEIVQLIVSCRLMGKGIAQALLHYACQKAREGHYSELSCRFIRNQYNRQMILLFTSNNLVTRNYDKNTFLFNYSLNLLQSTVNLPEWITLN